MKTHKLIRRSLIFLGILALCLLGLRQFMIYEMNRSGFGLINEDKAMTNLAIKNGIHRLEIAMEDYKIFAHWSQSTPGSPSVFVLHGNGETLSDWVDFQLHLRDIGYSSLVFDYAGFGSSEGKPSVEELDQNAKVAWRAFCKLASPDNERIALSHSLGTAVMLSSLPDFAPAPDRAIVHAAFTSAKEISIYQGLVDPKWAWIVPDLWNNKSNIKGIDIPICVVNSKSDEILPYTMGEAVAAQNDNAQFLLLEHNLHNDIRITQDSILIDRLFNCW